MKQRFTITFLLCVLVIGMYANPITREEARQKAVQFLTDKKGNFLLLIMEENKRADIKNIEKTLEIKKLTFANEKELNEILGLNKGSCTPFGIINDKKHITLLLIDKDLKGKKLLFHPNRNTATISIEFNDLLKFIKYENNEYMMIQFL